jgi:hypothetical protein
MVRPVIFLSLMSLINKCALPDLSGFLFDIPAFLFWDISMMERVTILVAPKSLRSSSTSS